MPKTKTERATYIREWRKINHNQKRFNKPLREYMELKHRDNYNEYCQFFKTLDENHPTAKDLTKTSTYKKWKRQQMRCEASDDETTETELTQNESETEIGPAEPVEPENEHAEPENEHPDVLTAALQETVEPENEHAEPENEHPDVLTAALQETFPPDIDNIDINEANDIIQRLIYEFEQDEALRGLLNNENNDELVHPLYQDDDEGIVLDVVTELEAVIEPFDYELEVEGVDF